jgi:gamma-glutamyltranspeptidase/glutathione hydrolase
MTANGGWIRLKDLKELPPPRVVPPLKGTYRGWDVHTLPPPFGGWVVLQALKVLEQVPSKQLAITSPSRLIWLAEALRIGHRSRLEAPIDDLVNYDAAIVDRLGKQTIEEHARSFARPGAGETTHFSIVDRDGMAVGVTASINSFYGAKVAHPRLGFLYNDYMRDFLVDRPNHPFALRPGAMAYSSMSATILCRNGEAALVLGSPGSKRIISTVVQVISHWVDGSRDVRAAVAAPRVHVIPERSLYVEDDHIPPSQLVRLERRGFVVLSPVSSLSKTRLNPYFGGVHAVGREASGWRGAPDPRRDGTAGGPAP